MTTTTYKNPWHDRGKGSGPATYSTEAKPVEYKGFLIYKIHSVHWDVVKDGKCCTQRAGFKGAKRWVDQQT